MSLRALTRRKNVWIELSIQSFTQRDSNGTREYTEEIRLTLILQPSSLRVRVPKNDESFTMMQRG